MSDVMREEQVNAAATHLWQLWQQGDVIDALDDAMRPQTRGDGYAIQERLARHSRHPPFGWKIAATSTAGQAHINVDAPMAGRLLRERAFESGAVVPFGHNRMRVAEAEFAFRMGVDLPPRARPYEMSEVVDAVATLHPAIEIPDSRYRDFTAVGAAQLIADNACAHYFVKGRAAPDLWRGLDLRQHRVTGTVIGRMTREGIGAAVLGDPRLALMWLANELSGLERTLRAGEIVTTGTCLVPLEIALGDEVVMDFGVLGAVEVRLGI